MKKMFVFMGTGILFASMNSATADQIGGYATDVAVATVTELDLEEESLSCQPEQPKLELVEPASPSSPALFSLVPPTQLQDDCEDQYGICDEKKVTRPIYANCTKKTNKGHVDYRDCIRRAERLLKKYVTCPETNGWCFLKSDDPNGQPEIGSCNWDGDDHGITYGGNGAAGTPGKYHMTGTKRCTYRCEPI